MSIESSEPPLVVVGIDGSLNSIEALRWAYRYALATNARLKAITASNVRLGFGFTPMSIEDFEHEARKTLEHTIEKTLGSNPKIPIIAEAVHHEAVAVLLEAAKEAELLVVGDRGVGGFGGLMLGSVSRRCVRSAPCSVIVVRRPS